MTSTVTNGTISKPKKFIKLEILGVNYLSHAVFEIKKNAVGRYYFVFKSDDNHNLVVTQSFLKRSEMEKCISEIRETATVAEICERNLSSKPPFFQLNEDANGWSCSLMGFSGNLVFISEKYKTKQECIGTMNTMKELSADAGIVDTAI